MSEIIDGRALAKDVTALVKEKLLVSSIDVTLAIIKIGDDPASEVYIRNKTKTAESIGINVEKFELDKTTSLEKVTSLINQLNENPKINGILLQLPLPAHLPSRLLIDTICPDKDVDGLTSINQGRLFVGAPETVFPCTPMGVLHMLRSVCSDLAGMHAIVLGRSQIVGKPLAQMLLQTNCSVSLVHSYSQNLPDICRLGDIVISAVGRPCFVKADWVKEGAIVIDVGISKKEHDEKIYGDIDFLPVSYVAKAISPVPGGVGPMTVAYLMHNALQLAIRQQKNT